MLICCCHVLIMELAEHYEGIGMEWPSSKQVKPKTTDPANMTHVGQYDILFISWTDRNQVNLILPIHTDQTVTTKTRCKNNPDGWQEAGERETIQWQLRPTLPTWLALTWRTKPCSILSWHTRQSSGESCCWVFGMFEVSFCNTLAIYRKLHPGQCTDRNRIRMSIINHLCDGYRRGRGCQVAGPQLELHFT